MPFKDLQLTKTAGSTHFWIEYGIRMNTVNDFESVNRVNSLQSKNMATGVNSRNASNLETKFTCPVCLEIFAQPTRIPCGHTFCANCIAVCVTSKPLCPVCRAGFNPRRRTRADKLESEMQATVEPCTDCKSHFLVSELRHHSQSCKKRFNKAAPGFAPVTPTTRVPNHSTFPCPYCVQKNLDHDALLSHVNSSHRSDTQQVVCPICASMPWGDPYQKSGNFIQHLNLRHKFEYDTFVDFEKTEDDILKDVLTQSMLDQ